MAPYEPRGSGDQSTFRQLSRKLKESGVVLGGPATSRSRGSRMPRVIVKRSRIGCMHPAEKADIVNLLQFFGPECFYGLRSISLVQGSGTADGIFLPFGRLAVPGEIILYDQPKPPWFVGGSISSAERAKLERAGALVETSEHDMHSLIRWTENDLKNFMLFEVFMHEVGHHIIQQYKGKRSARVMRTKDHERFADSFAKECRHSYLAKAMSDGNA